VETTRSVRRLALDEAFIAFLIAAMDANRHVSREEAARAMGHQRPSLRPAVRFLAA